MAVSGEMQDKSTRGDPLTVFKSEINIDVPVVDIVSYAMARLEEHDRDCVIYADASDPNSFITAGSVRDLVAQIAAGLRKYGVETGDTVCIHSWNSVYYPLLWLAIISIGGVVTGSNPAYTSPELVHHFRITGTKFVISHIDCIQPIKEAALECDISSTKIFTLGTDLSANPQPHPSLEANLLKQDSLAHESIDFSDKDEQDTSIVVYATTSGTTGLPKAAELSHRYFVAQATSLEHVFSKRKDQIRQLISLPVFHAFAAQLAIVLPLRLGIATYFMPRFELKPYLEHIHQFQITDSPVVPAIIGRLLLAPTTALSSLRYLVCAGAPMTAAVQARLSSKMDPQASIAQCWGATELGWITLFDQSEPDNTRSIGRLMPNTILKIVDEHGHPITTDGVPGEACIQSSSMLRSYRGISGEKITALDDNGYYLTGDRVFMRNGKVFLDGRIKDIMKVNGWQVSPEELERVILQLESVVDCAVVGHKVINIITGLEETKPRALVVRHPSNSSISEAEIRAHVKCSLVGYKQLSGGVLFVEKIPRSNTGKILRRKLSDLDIQKGAEEKHAGYEHDHLDSMHAKMMFLVPLFFMLGLPGLVILVLGVRVMMTDKSRKH